jgi:hypothetical protein
VYVTDGIWQLNELKFHNLSGENSNEWRAIMNKEEQKTIDIMELLSVYYQDYVNVCHKYEEAPSSGSEWFLEVFVPSLDHCLNSKRNMEKGSN